MLILAFVAFVREKGGLGWDWEGGGLSLGTPDCAFDSYGIFTVNRLLPQTRVSVVQGQKV